MEEPGTGKRAAAQADRPFTERRAERRADPLLATLVDVAIAYRDNLGSAVAQAFMRETGLPGALVQRVLDRSACQRAALPRRWAPRALVDAPAPERPA